MDHTFSVISKNLPDLKSQSYFSTLRLLTFIPLKMIKNYLNVTTIPWQSLSVGFMGFLDFKKYFAF